MGRNTSNENASNDFTDADENLNTTNHSNNINYTFSTGGTNPKETTWFDVHGINITYVPIANSTNNVNFTTGILWQSGGSADEEYDGTHDLVFVSKINNDEPGKYSICDYEMRVPATPDTYKGGTEVCFYVELIN